MSKSILSEDYESNAPDLLDIPISLNQIPELINSITTGTAIAQNIELSMLRTFLLEPIYGILLRIFMVTLPILISMNLMHS